MLLNLDIDDKENAPPTTPKRIKNLSWMGPLMQNLVVNLQIRKTANQPKKS